MQVLCLKIRLAIFSICLTLSLPGIVIADRHFLALSNLLVNPPTGGCMLVQEKIQDNRQKTIRSRENSLESKFYYSWSGSNYLYVSLPLESEWANRKPTTKLDAVDMLAVGRSGATKWHAQKITLITYDEATEISYAPEYSSSLQQVDDMMGKRDEILHFGLPTNLRLKSIDRNQIVFVDGAGVELFFIPQFKGSDFDALSAKINGVEFLIRYGNWRDNDSLCIPEQWTISQFEESGNNSGFVDVKNVRIVWFEIESPTFAVSCNWSEILAHSSYRHLTQTNGATVEVVDSTPHGIKIGNKLSVNSGSQSRGYLVIVVMITVSFLFAYKFLMKPGKN